MQRIAIVGAGYVGLVTGACLAALGHRVTCLDVDAAKVAGLKAGVMPIYEAGLADLVARETAAGRLAFTTDLAEAAREAAAAFICVGTPARPDDGHADLTAVFAAAGALIGAMPPGAVLVVKSTVPVGTGDEIEAMARAAGADLPVASNPEFLREGVAIADFMSPDRIVVGVETAAAEATLAAIYRPLTDKGAAMLVTNRRASELVKHTANAFLAIKINFINEIANLCEEVGADVEAVARGVGLDGRIGPKFLKPGPGFGGSCFPKDMLALIRTGHEHGVPLRSVETAVAVNDARKGEMVRKIVRAFGGSLQGKRVALLGLTFKAGTDDMRSAASLVIAPRLVKAGATVVAYDPAGMKTAARLMPELTYAPDAMTAIDGADGVVILTEWPEFATLDLAAVRAVVAAPLVVDLRNLLQPEEVAAAGLRLTRLGLKPSPAA